jgi:hypothetical protein
VPTGSLDRDAMRRQVRACVRNGAHGIAVLGLATEVGKLTQQERRVLVELVADEVAGRIPVAVTGVRAYRRGTGRVCQLGGAAAARAGSSCSRRPSVGGSKAGTSNFSQP